MGPVCRQQGDGRPGRVDGLLLGLIALRVPSVDDLQTNAAKVRVDIARQIWSASVVGRRKYRLVAWSIGFLVGAIALTAAAGVATSLWG
jgi:hypothetical protein